MNDIDDETLINFKEASRNTDDFLDKERFYWIRIIQRYNCLIGKLHDVWKKVVKKTPVEIIKELAVALHQFPQTMFFDVALGKFPSTCFSSRKRESASSSGKSMSYLDFVQNIELHWHPLFIGAACGSVNICNHIIQKAGDTDPRLSDGRITPLVFAAKIMEDVNVFKFLLGKAEDKNPILTKYSNWTLLHEFASKGNLVMCRLMVKKLEDKSPQNNDGQTPLHSAARNGNVELCKVLMEFLMDKNPKDHMGQTPLHSAASNGSVELCRILTENLMDKNPEDLSGQTPFHKAASCGYLDVCRLFMDICVDKNHVDDGVRTPLHIAALKGHVEVVGLFMANLVDKNLKDNEGPAMRDFRQARPPYHHHCRHPAGAAATSFYLAKSRQDSCLGCLASRGSPEKTPLLSAIQGGNFDVCKLLIEQHKVDVNISDGYGMTPLHLASKLGRPKTVELLCKYVLDKNTFDNNGKTPMDLAVSEAKWKIVEILEDHGGVRGHFMINIEDKNIIDNMYTPMRDQYEEI